LRTGRIENKENGGESRKGGEMRNRKTARKEKWREEWGRKREMEERQERGEERGHPTF